MKRNVLFCAQRKVLQSMLIGGAMLSACAQAQEPASEPASEQKDADAKPKATAETQLDTIMVTAQRRSERLQDVPISIAAIGAEELALRNVNDLKSLSATVPGLLIAKAVGTNIVALRGVSGMMPVPGASPGVAIYLDGVYLARPESGFFALDDVERIEVLRGPQGTLYGRNSTGGAINIITREPDNKVRGGFDINYGNYSSVNAKGSLSGPLGGGFSGGISVGYTDHDGYFRNPVTGHDLEAYKSSTIRGKLRYVSQDDAFSALLSADQAKVDSSSAYQSLYSGASPLNAVYVGLGAPYEVPVDAATESLLRVDVRSKGVGLTMNYTPNEHVSFTSVSGYREFDNAAVSDVDGSAGTAGPPVGMASKGIVGIDTFNTELRSVLTFDRFRATVGASYYHEDQTANYGVAPLPLFGPLGNPLTTTNLKASAVFAQVEYDVSKPITLVGGLRWNREDRDYTVSHAGAPGWPKGGNIKDTALIPSVGVNYKLSPDALLYVKYSQGYLAPGYNSTPGAASTIVNTFGAETLDTYELGLKSQFFDRRLTFNAAAFHSVYKDMQVRVTVAPGVGQVLNAGKATINGIETSLSYASGTGLTVSGYLNWLDAIYDDFCEIAPGNTYYQANDPLCAPGVINRSGNRLNQSPKWQGGASLGYYRAIGDDKSLQFNLNYSTTSNVYYAPANIGPFSSGRMERLNARLGLQFGNGPEVYVYANNLTNEAYVDSVIGSSAPYVTAHIADPRTYGIGVKYRF